MQVQTQKVVLNTPKGLDIKATFPTASDAELHKIIFMIHEVNYWTIESGACRYNRDVIRRFLGVSPNDYLKILELLKVAGIIIQTEWATYDADGDGSVEGRNNGYSMITTFNFKNDDEIEKHVYDLNDNSTPLFIHKWVADDFKILEKPKNYKFKKPTTLKPVVKLSKTKQLEQLVIEQQTLIDSLNAEIAQRNELLKILEETVGDFIAMPTVA